MTSTKTLRPGALYMCQPDELLPILLSEVLHVDASDNAVYVTETESTNSLETPAVVDVDVFGDVGTYVYTGDVRDHQNNPDVGDVFLWDLDMAAPDNDGFTEPDCTLLCVVEILSFSSINFARRVTVLVTSVGNGVSWTEVHRVARVAEQARYVGHTRPVFDTPERYADKAL